jgi:hypothetical protein
MASASNVAYSLPNSYLDGLSTLGHKRRPGCVECDGRKLHVFRRR